MTPAVQRLGAADAALPRALAALLAGYGLRLVYVDDAAIPGSYWGDSEAGLVGHSLNVRADTPLHSALHEACHYICADPPRRAALDTDAGGNVLEECGVCYLQVLLAAALPDSSSARMLEDMDTWGYSFRLGSARAWFEEDAADARDWLLNQGVIDVDGQPSGRCAEGPWMPVTG